MGQNSEKISIIGNGSWGTTLASILAQNGHSVIVHGRDPQQIDALNRHHENTKYLPGIKLPEQIIFTADLHEALSFGDVVLLAIPSHAFRNTILEARSLCIKKKLHFISAIKGIETTSLMRMSEVAADVLQGCTYSFTCLSGPSHAEEVSKNIPTTIVAASAEAEAAQFVQRLFMRPAFRVYSHTDIVGAELGGALKNVIALAAGICDGLGFGDNAKAALLTRGLAEISRLGTALGANPLTFAGLSGMGDLIVTCMSAYSRNRFLGEEIGKGKTLSEARASMVMVAEGVRTTEAARALSLKHNIEMPITEEVYEVLFKDRPPGQGVNALMTRSAKDEKWGH